MIFKRLIEQIGNDKFNKIQNSTVLILGLGGVGSFACESLVRSGVGTVIIVDKDVVDETNINRQLVALHSTIGKAKTEVMKERILDINPKCNVITYHEFYNFETKEMILNHDIDFIVDCIDTITFKFDVIKEALHRKIKIISSMGAGNKLAPEQFEITDISKTSYCPVARVIRGKLKKERIYGKVPVVYSKEEPYKEDKVPLNPSSNSFVPASAGLLLSSYVIREIIK